MSYVKSVRESDYLLSQRAPRPTKRKFVTPEANRGSLWHFFMDCLGPFLETIGLDKTTDFYWTVRDWCGVMPDDGDKDLNGGVSQANDTNVVAQREFRRQSVSYSRVRSSRGRLESSRVQTHPVPRYRFDRKRVRRDSVSPQRERVHVCPTAMPRSRARQTIRPIAHRSPVPHSIKEQLAAFQASPEMRRLHPEDEREGLQRSAFNPTLKKGKPQQRTPFRRVRSPTPELFKVTGEPDEEDHLAYLSAGEDESPLDTHESIAGGALIETTPAWDSDVVATPTQVSPSPIEIEGEEVEGEEDLIRNRSSLSLDTDADMGPCEVNILYTMHGPASVTYGLELEGVDSEEWIMNFEKKIRVSPRVRESHCLAKGILHKALPNTFPANKYIELGKEGIVSSRRALLDHLREMDLLPKHKVSLGDVNYYISKPFIPVDSSSTHFLAVAFIEMDGVLFHQLLYHSNSQGVWRVMGDSTLKCEKGEFTLDWYGKAGGEMSTQLPLSVNCALNAHLPLSNAERVGGIQYHLLVSDWGTYSFSEMKTPRLQDAVSIYKGKRGKGGREVKLLTTKKTKNSLAPSQSRYVNKSHPFYPNFGTLLFRTQLTVPMYGEVEVSVYPSGDETLHYMFYHVEGVGCFLASVENVEAPLNYAGLRARSFDPEELADPLVEYLVQSKLRTKNRSADTKIKERCTHDGVWKDSYCNQWKTVQRRSVNRDFMKARQASLTA